MKIVQKAGAAVAAAVLTVSTQVYAALPEGVATALTGLQTDMTDLYETLTTVGIALFVAGAIYAKFAIRRR